MSIRLPEVFSSIIEATMSPHPVDRYLELVDPMLTWRDLRARVIRVERPTDRTVRLTLAPTRQWQGHEAGQFIQLSVVVEGVRQTRCFSPANAAAGPEGTVELTITAHDDGLVSRYLRKTAAVGDVYGLSQAAGDFVLPAEVRAPVFISGGSGITPALSMLRTLVANGYDEPVTFVHYARKPSDLAYRAELTALAAVHPHLDLRLHYTRGTEDAGMDEGVIGHFTGAHLEGIADHDDADVFVCGPATLMDAVFDHYETAHPHARVHSEAFTLAVPAAIDPHEPVHGELSFTASGTSATNDGRTILDQAESAGLSPESGCRMGICFSCTAIKKSGCTRNVLTGETDTESDTQIQLCINAPVGDVEIEV
ncbi:ferredoxin reductase [Gordonia oryzae]|uniref:Ferredoxin reductase n=1 Tax=Gordonia oryzae TaxID=2487349 RepID=A0A3N4H3C2_9ACTN|nr:FAD-binding oxidoreductase [Gordonia oryzae]RPA65330.1 ferredoxin reductase [Gordonia oryzae]